MPKSHRWVCVHGHSDNKRGFFCAFNGRGQTVTQYVSPSLFARVWGAQQNTANVRVLGCDALKLNVADCWQISKGKSLSFKCLPFDHAALCCEFLPKTALLHYCCVVSAVENFVFVHFWHHRVISVTTASPQTQHISCLLFLWQLSILSDKGLFLLIHKKTCYIICKLSEVCKLLSLPRCCSSFTHWLVSSRLSSPLLRSLKELLLF